MMAEILTIPQNDLQSFTDIGSFNWIITLHFYLIGFYDGFSFFSIMVKPMYVKLSLTT